MIQRLIYVMVYLGSLLMAYNIYGFVRFARYVRDLKTWDKGSHILSVPIVLLVCFLLGYLAVGFFGKPDLIVAAILLGGSAFVFAMYKLLNDITHKIVASEHLEAELLAAEESNRVKTSFLASMSHEMRTPLNAIIGLNDIALKDDSLCPKTRDRLEKVGFSARHLLEMINDVLDVNYIDSVDMHLNEEPFSLREMLELVNVLAQTRCREKGVEYHAEISEALESRYVGDSMWLRQVLLSILDNAVKFTPAGGDIWFAVQPVAPEGERPALRFTVTDSGEGIDAAFIPKLFDSFSQEDASTTNRFGGSGLGLTIAKKLVNMMGGDIAVTSEKGRGSSFAVTVPLPVYQDEADAAHTAEGALLAGRHILIAEDMDLNAEMLADLLELEDITSERAENGRAALDLFRDSPPGRFDAILMDLRMPVMDGLEAARAIRALDREDAGTIPIIALTANTFEEDVRHSLEAGMNWHLSKPVDADLLFDTLRTLLA